MVELAPNVDEHTKQLRVCCFYFLEFNLLFSGLFSGIHQQKR